MTRRTTRIYVVSFLVLMAMLLTTLTAATAGAADKALSGTVRVAYAGAPADDEINPLNGRTARGFNTFFQEAFISKYPDVKIEISGHTDNVGKREYNVDLSTRRAESVRQYLIGKGVKAERITTRGAGPDEPIADNGNAKSRAKNRRIEFKLVLD